MKQHEAVACNFAIGTSSDLYNPEAEPRLSWRIASDLIFMEKRLDLELGEQPGLLAFPFGAYNQVVMEEARNAGIELFFTTEEGMNEAGTRLVRRINAGEPYMTADLLWDHMNKFF